MVASANAAHVSCYNLTYKEKTSLSINQKRGLVSPHPTETEEKFFTLTSQWLTSKGFDHYEVSNFARGSSFIAKHNQAYWNGADYLGVGPAAHSLQNHERWWNVASLEKYVKSLENKQSPVAERELLNSDQQLMESVLLGLRKRQGFAKKTLNSIPDFEPRISQLKGEGLITESEDSIFPTTKGFLVADELAAFLTA
jgi:oxygen-independent coproporphyrinogen-3 oxidase